MNEQLRNPQALFQPTADAGCAVSSATIDAPVLDAGAQPVAKAAPGNAPAGDKGDKGHTGDKGDKAKGKPAHADPAHADLVAQYVFRCANPERLRDMEVRLFEPFRGLRQLEVRIVGPRGQSVRTLRRGNAGNARLPL